MKPQLQTVYINLIKDLTPAVHFNRPKIRLFKSRIVAVFIQFFSVAARHTILSYGIIILISISLVKLNVVLHCLDVFTLI
jgi:hypothetical protein